LILNNFYVPVTIELVGGPTSNSGHVFATNPRTGFYGPVCDDNFGDADVIESNLILLVFVLKFQFLTKGCNLAAVVVLLLEVSLYKMMRQLSNRNTYV
jgi:hypothetical protein